MQDWLCATCGVAYPPSGQPPAHCPICEDPRQYINPKGQQWLTLDAIAGTRRVEWRELEPGLIGIGLEPAVGIGQRMLFMPQPGGGVLWDCIPWVDEATLERIRGLGGVRAMAISHPHFYSAMTVLSERLGGVPIHLSAADSAHVMRPSPLIRHWAGERLELGQGITLIRCGGHFEGSTALHWAAGADGRGVLMTGDTIQVVADTHWVSFMRSYPNLIPLPAARVEAIAATVAPFGFERLYGGWWDRVVPQDAHAAVARSAARYVAALEG